MSDDVKFCKDCKFYKLSLIDRLFGLSRLGECTRFHKENSRMDYLVSGKKEKLEFWYATVVRYSQCGSEAHFFERKEPKVKIRIYTE